MLGRIGSIAKKEFSTYFSSPIAFIFIGTFLVVSMFIFFWVERFFSRNIVDVRPLFESMPLLLVFLVGALTMKMWSEERRMGTIEFLLTSPVKTYQLVIGKFVACVALVALALALTIGVPITVSFMGNLDWGPVIGAYIASLLLAGAYVSIGLYISAKSDNQIVSLILTIVVCFLLYLLGTDAVGTLVGTEGGELLRLLGTGSRFESIGRGVIDLRDLYYYVSIAGIFLSLNVFSIEKLRWSKGTGNTAHRSWRIITILLATNFLVANVWLYQVSGARADLTEGKQYTISRSTEGLLEQLQEPLLIRGYFGFKTHPLLAPLVPQIRDLISEYAVAGKGKVRAEFLDPREYPTIEEEANRKYNIRPIPFRIDDKYEASMVNSYFHVLIQYGDQHQVLGFQELIEVKPKADMTIDVQLRNLEYDITRSIKKVMFGFKNLDSMFAAMKEPVKFTGYISPRTELPPKLAELRGDLESLLDEFQSSATDKFSFELVDPMAGDQSVAKEIMEEYGLRPMAAGLLDSSRFYFYMVVTDGNKILQAPLPEENLNRDGLRGSLEGALKRLTPGFLKTVGVSTPPQPQMNPMMMQMGMNQGGKQFNEIQRKLREGYTIKNLQLSTGTVAEDVDLLMVLSPKDLTTEQLFAIDQFLMKGGTVLLSTSPYSISAMGGGISAEKHSSGVTDWLQHHGIQFQERLILDPQNEPYPVPVRRNLGGFQVEEIKMVNYPHFPDIRTDGLNQDVLITSGIPHVTINWPSPVLTKGAKDAGRSVTDILQTSSDSWITESLSVEPDFKLYPDLGFPRESLKKPYTVATLVEGRFDSFFKGKESPLLKAKEDTEEEKEGEEDKKEEDQVISGVIDKSPESARIILFSSNEFLADQTLRLSAASGTERYMNSLRLVENAIDWSLEDRALLAIRSRGRFSRTLVPMENGERMFWEYLNYGLALLGLLFVYLVYKGAKVKARSRYRRILALEGV